MGDDVLAHWDYLFSENGLMVRRCPRVSPCVMRGSDRILRILPPPPSLSLLPQAFKDGALFAEQSLKLHLGDEKLNKFINFVLKYLSGIELPVKRGTFIEFRAGMINISPVGRNCSQEERDAFEEVRHAL
jgi:hypothetical protein